MRHRDSHAPARRRTWALIVGGLMVVCVSALTAPQWLPFFWQMLAPETLAGAANTLRQLGVWAPIASITLMVLQSVIAPLPGSLIAAANGLLFGVWWGSLLSWAGGMAGALVTYALGHALSERAMTRWSQSRYWQQLTQLGEARGFWIVLVARLTPVISLDFIGYLAGAARMPLGRYLLANLIGLAPGMIIYTAVGHNLAYARESLWQLGIAALVLVGLFLGGRYVIERRLS